MRPARLALCAALAAPLLAGCGGSAGDLLAIEVSGGFANVREKIKVTDDGRASCNRGSLEAISSDDLLVARGVKRALRPLARRGADYPAGRVRDARLFVFTSQDGAVSWSEGARGLPPAVGRATLLALRLERRLCPR